MTPDSGPSVPEDPLAPVPDDLIGADPGQETDNAAGQSAGRSTRRCAFRRLGCLHRADIMVAGSIRQEDRDLRHRETGRW